MRRIVDRFDEYMQYRHINDNIVTKNLGLTNGVIGKSRKEGRDLSKRVVELIENFYTDLNSRWLRYGEGEMLKGETKPDTKVEEYLRIIASQQETIARLSCVIERLTQKRERDALTA